MASVLDNDITITGNLTAKGSNFSAQIDTDKLEHIFKKDFYIDSIITQDYPLFFADKAGEIESIKVLNYTTVPTGETVAIDIVNDTTSILATTETLSDSTTLQTITELTVNTSSFDADDIIRLSLTPSTESLACTLLVQVIYKYDSVKSWDAN